MKKRKLKFVKKPKPKRRVKKPSRNWLELPSNLVVNILQRIDVFEILENAQKVCTAWRDICKDPAMWRVIYIDRFPYQSERVGREIIKCVVDRSRGQLLDLTIVGICDHELLQYVVDRSEALKKLSSLEELSFFGTCISQQDIEAAGHYCPLLKTLRLSSLSFRCNSDEVALAIGKNLHQLTYLELIQNGMKNTGLEAILDGCCHLESLDLRGCWKIDLTGDLGKRCLQQIKHLKLPYHSL
ncbi:putative F-box protein At4g05475 isoform X2 [Bidens hawaiensis]|uniref:putative F-box protein At4g05475 isoform X2 n=1 Tax=Bidens hawaiensis TaxID=980011 RepID=UPI004049F60B